LLREYADPVPFAWPLTGRSEEMRAIEAAIANAAVAGVVVYGAAGIGKSRIVREALNVSSAKGWQVRWVVATSSAKTLPLGAFAAWADTNVTDNLQLVRAVVDSLTHTESGSAVIIGVDDAHLLDDLSAFVLHQIVQRGAAKVVLTVRDGEPVPVPIQDVWKVGQFERLDLQPLSLGEVGALLAAVLGGPMDPDALQRLWKLTRGNALYLRNIVEREADDGRLARRERYWSWTGDPVLPPDLVAFVDSRMGALPAPVSDVIDALAVGEPIELAALTRITSASAVEEADMRGLITLDEVDAQVEVRVAHPLYGEVRRNRAAATRLRRLRGRVASELASSDGCDEVRVLVRRAMLGLDADLEPDPTLFTRAAYGATWLLDLPLAVRLADAAVRAGGGADALFIHTYLLSWLDQGRQAEIVLAGIPALDLPHVDRAKLTFIRAINYLFALADADRAKNLIDEAERATPSGARACIAAARLVYSAVTGCPDAALKASTGVTKDRLPDAVARMSAWAITVAAGDVGRTASATEAAKAAYTIPIRGYLIVLDAQVSAHILAGQLEAAQEAAEVLKQRAEDYPSPKLFPLSDGVMGTAALGGGRLDKAVTCLDRTVELLAASGETLGWTYRYQLVRTIALAMRGLAREAQAALLEVERCRHPSWRYLDYERGLARGWVAAAQGAVSEALKLVFAGAETARANGQFAAEVMCLQTATQFGDGSHAARLRTLGHMVEGPRASLAARFAAALADGDADELSAVSREFEDIGDSIAAMDASAHAAMFHRRAERRGSALTCSARADELAERCGGASTPALLAASEPVPLTDREREIAMMLARGYSTRAIAERLTVSVRTVEGHIYRAMAKTGATDRDQLVRMLPSR
jgi:DNA-binding CsgD family transcriptional regulator